MSLYLVRTFLILASLFQRKMPARRRGNGWTRPSKAKRKEQRERYEGHRGDYQNPHTVADWISLGLKGRRLTRQCNWNNPKIDMWDSELECDTHDEDDCGYWRSYGDLLCSHLEALRKLPGDSVPPLALVQDMFRTHKAILLKNVIPCLVYSLVTPQKNNQYPCHFI